MRGSPKIMLIAVVSFMLFALLPGALAQESAWEANVGDIVYGLALSADGSVQIVGSRNNRAAAYDPGGNLLWEFAPGGTVWGVGISADGQWTSVASEDRKLYLLDAQGRVVWSISSSMTFVDTAVAQDGSWVVAADDNRQIYIVDRATGRVLLQQGLQDRTDTVAVYGTGDALRVLAGTRASRVHLFDGQGREVWQARLDRDVLDVAVSDDGARAVVGTLDGKIALLNGDDGGVLWQRDPPDPVSCTPKKRANCIKVAISGDGAQILVGTLNGSVYLLNSADGAVLQKHTLNAPIPVVAISSDGGTLMFGTRDGLVRSITTAGAAATLVAAQQARTALVVGALVVVLVAGAAGTLWVRRTASGRHFWQVRTAPIRRTVALMWRKRVSYLLILPTIALLLIFNYYPAASGLYHAFTDWVPGVETKWVGLEQFRIMFNSPYFWTGVKNAILIALTGILKLTMPLLVAELIFHVRNRRLQYSLRTAFILPLVLPSVVGILLWVNIYDPNIGLLNQTLTALGQEHLVRSWLGDKDTAMAAILFMGFPWVGAFALLIFYGGLISIPDELFDAAKVDGANWWQRFRRIDLPMLMGAIKLLLILAFIGSMQEFQSIFLTTGGGPGNVTYTPALELYYQATRFTNYGLASAMGTVLFLVILGATVLNLRYVRSQTEYEPQ